MRLMPVLFGLCFVHISQYNNNPLACFSCLSKLIQGKYGHSTGGTGYFNQNGNNQNGIYPTGNYPNSNYPNGNNQNINTNINTNTNINSNTNIDTSSSAKLELDRKAVEILEAIGKTLVNMWSKMFNDEKNGNNGNSGNSGNNGNNGNNGKNGDNGDNGDNGNNRNNGNNGNNGNYIVKPKGGLTDPDVINAINAFFAKLSENQVKTILIPQPDGLLIDEIYVTGLWDIAFDPRKTKSRSFYLTTKSVKLPTMINTAAYNYGISGDLDASLLELPFDDGNGSLLIVLPSSPDGIVDLMNQLQSPSLLDDAVAQMEQTNVQVFLPKFKIETMFDIKMILGKIAIPGVTLRSNQAFQKVIIEINEEGKPGSRRNNYSPILRRNTLFRVQWPFYYEVRFYKKPLFNGVYGVK